MRPIFKILGIWFLGGISVAFIVASIFWALDQDAATKEKLIAIPTMLVMVYLLNREGLRISNRLNLLPAATVYVKLKKEGEESFRPLIAHRETDKVWRIDPKLAEPCDEEWEFKPNELIEIKHRIIARIYAPIAVEPKSDQGGVRQ